MVTAPTGRRPCATSSYCSGNRICRVVSSIGAWPSSRAYVRTRSARQPEDKDDSSAGAAPIVIRGHPTGVRCTDLHSETGSAGVRRHPTPGDDRFAAGAVSAREPNRTISDRAGSRSGEMPVHRAAACHCRPVAPAPTPCTTDSATIRLSRPPADTSYESQEAGATPQQLPIIGLGHESPAAGFGVTALLPPVSGADSWPPMSRRKGGYLSVISAA